MAYRRLTKHNINGRFTPWMVEMAINLKNAEVESLVRELARRYGVDLTEAIRLAVHRELQRGSDVTQAKLQRMRPFSTHLQRMPLLDARTVKGDIPPVSTLEIVHPMQYKGIDFTKTDIEPVRT